MKKMILTFLGVLCLTVTASAQLATIENNSDCTIGVALRYADIDCLNPTTPTTHIVLPGGTVTPTMPIGSTFIISAMVYRVFPGTGNLCGGVFVTPPPTCVWCQTSGPQMAFLPAFDSCCPYDLTVDWYETSCTGTTQTTTIQINM